MKWSIAGGGLQESLLGFDALDEGFRVFKQTEHVKAAGFSMTSNAHRRQVVFPLCRTNLTSLEETLLLSHVLAVLARPGLGHHGVAADLPMPYSGDGDL